MNQANPLNYAASQHLMASNQVRDRVKVLTDSLTNYRWYNRGGFILLILLAGTIVLFGKGQYWVVPLPFAAAFLAYIVYGEIKIKEPSQRFEKEVAVELYRARGLLENAEGAEVTTILAEMGKKLKWKELTAEALIFSKDYVNLLNLLVEYTLGTANIVDRIASYETEDKYYNEAHRHLDVLTHVFLYSSELNPTEITKCVAESVDYIKKQLEVPIDRLPRGTGGMIERLDTIARGVGGNKFVSGAVNTLWWAIKTFIVACIFFVLMRLITPFLGFSVQGNELVAFLGLFTVAGMVTKRA